MTNLGLHQKYSLIAQKFWYMSNMAYDIIWIYVAFSSMTVLSVPLQKISE